MPKPAKTKTADPADLAVKLLRARELGRRHYSKSDRLLTELRRVLQPGQEIALPGGKKARIKDLFESQDKVFRSHGIGRYELEVFDA